jgi:Ca2+-binding EF-hand superfamily protein
MTEAEIIKMFELVDSDHSGFIDYSEFVVASISDKALTSSEKL